MENNRDNGNEVRWRVLEMEEVQTVPWSVTRQGDDAIQQFFQQQNLGLTLRMASTTSAMYLRQASALARIIN